TLVTYDKLASEGGSLGFPPDSIAKVEAVRAAGMESLAIMKKAGLPMAHGSDLLGEMHRHQSEEYVIRGRVLAAHEVIASATTVANSLQRWPARNCWPATGPALRKDPQSSGLVPRSALPAPVPPTGPACRKCFKRPSRRSTQRAGRQASNSRSRPRTRRRNRR